MNRQLFRAFPGVLLLFMAGSVSAIGLGELRGEPLLGARLAVEIDLLGAGKPLPEASCFRLVPPRSTEDLPWLRHAGLNVRDGSPAVLEVVSSQVLREPIMSLAVQLGCGHEIQREYLLLASPEVLRDAATPSSRAATTPAKPADPPVRRLPPTQLQAAAESVVPPPRKKKPTAPKPSATGLPVDRLVLLDAGSAEPGLRLATELLALPGHLAGADEASRDMLRLEFRMLLALHEQALSQLAVAEKLRTLEATLSDLQARTTAMTERAAPPPTPQTPGTSSTAKPAIPDKPSPTQAVPAGTTFPQWGLWGALLGALVGAGTWLFLRRRREQLAGDDLPDYAGHAPEIEVDPQRADEREELAQVDLHFEPALPGAAVDIDVELDGASELPAGSPKVPDAPVDSRLSINATTVDEHFEANPVMELADIMLSFGRVKGAAQALQEFIDNNPQEALQPWLRLMDVYRMAGMREEFENVARNLNQHFNVEIQQWSPPAPTAEAQYAPAGQERAGSLEEMPRIINVIASMWAEQDVVGYLYQLLRDNRGGQRQGLAFPVVEEILFLIELKETANRMEKDLAHA